jgi:site-specific DNA-cytosine methylase
MPEFTCLELFAGCGGMGYGFHQHGFRIVCANELEASIAETYKHNFPDTNIIVGDIVSDSIKDSICESFRDIECDVIIGENLRHTKKHTYSHTSSHKTRRHRKK